MFNSKFYRNLKDKINSSWMFFWLIIIIIIPFIIGIGLYFKSSLIFENHTISNLLFSSEWKPMAGKFGFFPFIVSSLWITGLALLIAGPICLLAAINLTQYAKSYVLKIMQPVIDILAGIPSVIYGVWGILVIVPFISKNIAPLFGIETSGYTILSASIVLSIMIIPFILNILIDVFRTIPEALTEAALSLGATHWQTIKRVLLKKAFPGIISAFGLGISRAFGETIAVLMVAGNITVVPNSSLDAGYPLPALIANNYGEMLSIPMYDSALMLAAFLLFIIVIIFNLFSRLTIAQFEKNM